MIKRLFGITTLGFAVLSASGADLRIDGIFRVEKMSMEGAKVILVSGEGETREITRDIAHFTLPLHLQTDYLVSFERPGCVTKQLLFNTRVPASFLAAQGFSFPFEVTLQPMPPDRSFEYAGPVGLIRFDASIGDFGYDTDYRVARDTVLVQRLERYKATLQTGALAHDRPVAMVRSSATGQIKPRTSPVKPPADPSDRTAVLAPMASEVPPMVHELIAARPLRKAAEMSSGAFDRALAIPSARALADPGSAETISAAVETDGTSWQGRRWADLEVDKLHVVATMRVNKGGRTDVFRKVTSFYGGTTYFRNGSVVSRPVFELGIAR